MDWRHRRRPGRLAIIGVLWLALLPNIAASQTISVTATVVDESSLPPANPIVQFKGVAAPSASVTIQRNGTAITTAPADTAAAFDLTLTDQPTGQQVYVIGATDGDGRALTPMTFALNLTAGSTTIILGIFLGPSIAIDKSAVKLGETVTVAGTTLPNSTVTVTVNSVQAQNYSFLADGNGRWSKAIDTTDVGVGTHSAKARATASGTGVSEYSASVGFAVNPLAQCDGKKSADLNCDGRINLTDFSVLLFFWLQVNPTNARSDINVDGRVTITDFSIMLFQWTG